MNKRVTRVAAILVAVLCLTSSQFANSAGVTGTSCPALGKTKIDAGKKYFCVSRNNLLVWNKGIVDPKPVILATPSPTPSLSPSPTPSPSPTIISPSPVVNDVTIENHSIGGVIWAEEFNNKSALDSKIWSARYCGQTTSNGGGTCYNDESQYYLPEAVSIDKSGNAVITTKYVTSKPSVGTCWGSKCFFTSGRFDTQGKVSFLYGYIEARIKMPKGSGNWPAFWMLGTNMATIGWPNSGEIDIAEGFGNAKTRASSAIHYSSNGSGCCDNHLLDYIRYDIGQDYSADFHTYGLGWLPNEVNFYVDRKLIFRASTATISSKFWPFNSSNFLILNNAVSYGEGFGGAWDGWLSSEMLIDYVRQYKIDGQGQVFSK